MKFLKILLLTFVTVACGQSSKEPVSSPQGATTEAKTDNSNIFSIAEVEKKYFGHAQEESNNASFVDTALIKKTNGKITLIYPRRLLFSIPRQGLP